MLKNNIITIYIGSVLQTGFTGFYFILFYFIIYTIYIITIYKLCFGCSRFLSVSVYRYTFLCIYVCICACVYVCMCVYVSMRICVRLSVYIAFMIFFSHPVVIKLKTLLKMYYKTFILLGLYSACIYLIKLNNRSTRTRCEICSKLTIKTFCFYC